MSYRIVYETICLGITPATKPYLQRLQRYCANEICWLSRTSI